MDEYLGTIRERPVAAQVSPGCIEEQLPREAPEDPEPLDAILEDFEQRILAGITHWNHPRFFGYFAISGSRPGILAESLTAALNVNGMLWRTSPAATELERRVLAWLAQWMGLPEGRFGIIFDTASVSTLHAVLAARHLKDPEGRAGGHRPDLVVYASEQAHSSVEKAVLALGMGQKNFRRIGVDQAFRMRTDQLESAIMADVRAGLRPCCIVATVGTTGATAVDPVDEVAELAQRYGLWLHVDAAYAGMAAMLPEMRALFGGVERADSLVVNPHKWLFTPMDCSVLYTRRPAVLREALSLTPDYLQTDDEAVNLMDYGIPLGRRFRALKLWFIMRAFGRRRTTEILRNHLAWAKALAERIEQDERFELAAPVLFSLVCFRLRGAEERTQELLERINRGGFALLSPVVLHGKLAIRFAIGNIHTTWQDVEATWEAISRAAESRA